MRVSMKMSENNLYINLEQLRQLLASKCIEYYEQNQFKENGSIEARLVIPLDIKGSFLEKIEQDGKRKYENNK